MGGAVEDKKPTTPPCMGRQNQYTTFFIFLIKYLSQHIKFFQSLKSSSVKS